MSITKRPYEISAAVQSVCDRLNRLYDEGAKLYFNTIRRKLVPKPSLHISVTNRCNLSCTYCYDKMSQPPFVKRRDMSTDVATRIFKQYPDPSYVFVLGGEPFLNPHAVEVLLDHCPNRMVISSNGQVLNGHVERILKKIMRRNEEGRGTLLQISCELGGVSCERNTRNAEEILRYFSHVCGRFMKVKYTLTAPDLIHIDAIARWYWDRNILVQFDYVDGGYEKGEAIDLSETNWKRVFAFILSVLHESFEEWAQGNSDEWLILRAKTLVHYVFPLTVMQIKHKHPLWSMCGVFGNSVYIGPGGELFPCHRWKASVESYGSLGEPCESRMLAFHTESWPSLQRYCEECVWRGSCGGVCPAVTCTYGGLSLIGRCKFMGALRDAVWSFLLDKTIVCHPQIDQYLDLIRELSPFYKALI
ncbi:MAG: radical SAM protein [Candidatus Tectomicrobia bacterium]|nr:radical SAM protein [Candidatus Tectomicrobia bacterium]